MTIRAMSSIAIRILLVDLLVFENILKNPIKIITSDVGAIESLVRVKSNEIKPSNKNSLVENFSFININIDNETNRMAAFSVIGVVGSQYKNACVIKNNRVQRLINILFEYLKIIVDTTKIVIRTNDMFTAKNASTEFQIE